MTTPRFAFAMIGLAAIGLGGTACTPVGAAIGAGASVGIAAAQERTVGAAIDDAVIQTQISERWFRHNEAMFQALDLTVVEGRVLITGSIEDPDKRVDAVRLAWQVDGVHEVINEVQLSESEGIRGFARDVRIAGELRSILTFDREVSAVNYSVDTVGGVIYLMGIARSQGELDRVIGHARNIDSVRRVVSYVRLIDEVPPGSATPTGTLTTDAAPSAAPAGPTGPREGVAVEPLSPQASPQTSSIE
ncbi:MAG: BON domain-containing protein [Alphaproteobacteria bacterium]|nr:BON domain-containing protein [Alphaproteobacteria bacterium SS10]